MGRYAVFVVCQDMLGSTTFMQERISLRSNPLRRKSRSQEEVEEEMQETRIRQEEVEELKSQVLGARLLPVNGEIGAEAF